MFRAEISNMKGKGEAKRKKSAYRPSSTMAVEWMASCGVQRHRITLFADCCQTASGQNACFGYNSATIVPSSLWYLYKLRRGRIRKRRVLIVGVCRLDCCWDRGTLLPSQRKISKEGWLECANNPSPKEKGRQ